MNENQKWKMGDKCYYVDQDNDSEVECYFLENVGNGICKLKIKGEKSVAVVKEDKLVRIDPPYWKSLEEDLDESGWDMENKLLFE